MKNIALNRKAANRQQRSMAYLKSFTSVQAVGFCRDERAINIFAAGENIAPGASVKNAEDSLMGPAECLCNNGVPPSAARNIRIA
ncbi:MAG TPA: hypothetical protein VL525_04070 [Mucilaginibacter sp.]|jgi:hypothetical protein|nr:hypothetical protein [Mucilaginibacter sp.]